jgi:hypothetical protein
MNSLPLSDHLPIEYLASSFDRVTNSYKYYWFLSILENIRDNQSRTILIDDLLARMVKQIWYPTNYFRISFGKQDRLGQIALKVFEHGESNQANLFGLIKRQIASKTPLGVEIKSLGNYVPYRFLRPFFEIQLRRMDDWKVNERIYDLALLTFSDSQKPCLYRFIGQPAYEIEIHKGWYEYINQNLAILTGFCLWSLVNYLQDKNPNVPGISSKLFEPIHRDLRRAKLFWDSVFDELGELTCIYSGSTLKKNNYSLDHFLPWRFVVHDLLWNIIPTSKSVNSAKSDFLPDMSHYFNPLYILQFQAIQIVSSLRKFNLLEDHLLLLGESSVNDMMDYSPYKFGEVLHNTIAPQIQIATNMGFLGGWNYMN